MEGSFLLTITALDSSNQTGLQVVEYVYDSIPPILTPLITASSKIKAFASLSFSANKALSSNITFVAPGCTLEGLTVSGQIATITLVGCAEQGSFSLTVTALDEAGNVGTMEVEYVFDSVKPVFIPALAASSNVTANSPLQLTANKRIQSTNATFVAAKCTLEAPVVVEETITANLVNCEGDGSFTLEVTALDEAGNVGTHTLRYTYTSKPSQTTSNLTNTPQETSLMSGVAIAAIVLACVALAAIIVALILFLLPSTRAHFK